MNERDNKGQTSRRRVCQALALLGLSSTAGCSSLPGGDSTPEETGDGSSVGIDDTSPPNIGDLIQSHAETVTATSYTLGIELQTAAISENHTKSLTYHSSEDGQKTQLIEATSASNGVNRLQQSFTPDDHHVLMDLTRGGQNAATLDIDDEPLHMTGESIFDELLVGATLAKGTKRQREGETIVEYDIDAHRLVDVESGSVVVLAEQYISAFELEWRSDDNQLNTIRLETTDVGDTTVTVPSS